MADSPLRKQISREVKRALHDAGLSAARAAAQMPSYEYRGENVQPQAKLLYRWMKGEVTAPLDRLQEFADAIGQTLVLHIGPDAKEAAPDIPERLDEIEMLVRAIASVSGVDLKRVETMRRELLAELRAQQPGAASPKVSRRGQGK